MNWETFFVVSGVYFFFAAIYIVGQIVATMEKPSLPVRTAAMAAG